MAERIKLPLTPSYADDIIIYIYIYIHYVNITNVNLNIKKHYTEIGNILFIKTLSKLFYYRLIILLITLHTEEYLLYDLGYDSSLI